MDKYILGKKMVKSVRRLNGKMCPESFPAKPLDFMIRFFVYLLDTYIYIHVHGYFLKPFLKGKILRSSERGVNSILTTILRL